MMIQANRAHRTRLFSRPGCSITPCWWGAAMTTLAVAAMLLAFRAGVISANIPRLDGAFFYLAFAGILVLPQFI